MHDIHKYIYTVMKKAFEFSNPAIIGAQVILSRE